MTKLDSLKQSISEMLVARGQPAEFANDTSLFDSGLLDSMSALKLLMELEAIFDLDLSDPDFDISRIDTLENISEMVQELAAA